MNTKYWKRMPSLGTVALATAAFICSCGDAEIATYSSKNKLWFTVEDESGIVVNDVTYSFSFYPGDDEIVIPFEINLTGAPLTEDREFAIAVVEEETTAVATEYAIESAVFHAGRSRDTLWVRLYKTPRLDQEDAVLMLRIAENDCFEQGLYDRLTARVTFNNTTAQPVWWTAEMTQIYFGPFSPEKFLAFYDFCKPQGIDANQDIPEMTKSELRKLLLAFKDHIEKNNITEKDGSLMVIPIH